MTILTVTKESFEAISDLPGVVFIDCWAAWCPPCRAFKPVFEQAAADHPNVTFGSLNTEEEPELAAALGIASIPTVMAFRDGRLVFNQPGALRAGDFAQLIAAVQDLAMPEARAEDSGEDSV